MEGTGHLYGEGEIKFKQIGTKRFYGGELILWTNQQDPRSLEEYILAVEVSWFDKIRAWLNGRIFIGDFKPEKPGYDFGHYYLVWCPSHQRYFVSCDRGVDQERLDCPECNKEYLRDIGVVLKKTENRSRDSLRLVKSNRRPKT